jgi:hypothetical protein
MKFPAPSVTSIAAVLLSAFATVVAAGDADLVTFGGEEYRVASSDAAADGNAIVEMVRSSDDINSWKKLVAFHRFPKLDDPKAAANELAALAKQRDPSSTVHVTEDSESSEFVVDFTASEAGSDTVELDVFKYGHDSSEEGLVAFQFAQRFKRGDSGELAKVREAAVEEAGDVDLTLAESYFGGAGASEDATPADDAGNDETSGDGADK